ncbi:MAG: ATP-binding protein, partial [bacterium]
KLVDEGMFYFFSRPRRFGKSLTVSTLAALFKGRKELFKGLWIENSDWEWKSHPVIEIDFSEIDLTDAETLHESLSINLDRIASVYGLRLKTKLLADKFVELILATSKKYHENVVVLVDEYDKPIINHLGKGEEGLKIARQNRDLLKNFFGVLKGGQVAASLRFVFITGISKFSRVSIFSDLNNLQDLTMHAGYADMLGYTQEELEHYFSDRIAAFAQKQKTSTDDILQKLREWFNGYRFTKADVQVYNPFSIVNVFSEYDFKTFWFETATPSFLVNLIKENDYPIPNIESLAVRQSTFSTYDLENLKLEALLFQTGYVTIQDFDGIRYRLGYPNQEVKTAFLEFLYDSLVDIADTVIKEQISRLHQYLIQEDLEQFIETTNAILSAIPYTQHQQQGESFYHTVFYLMVAASGVLVQTEPLFSRGRIDIAVEFKDKVYIIELKCNQSAEKAIAQIREKGYHEKYVQSGRKIFQVGINFDTEKRVIAEWQMEEV